MKFRIKNPFLWLSLIAFFMLGIIVGFLTGIEVVVDSAGDFVVKAFSLTTPQFILNVNETKMVEEAYKIVNYSNFTK